MLGLGKVLQLILIQQREDKVCGRDGWASDIQNYLASQGPAMLEGDDTQDILEDVT